MVEYREHLKAVVAIAGAFNYVTIPTGLTALVQNYASKSNFMNAMIIHEIMVQRPTAYAQTDNCKWHLSTKVETAVKKISDSGVIMAQDEKAGTAVAEPCKLVERIPIYPNEVVSSPNLYFAVDSSDTGNFDIDIIYTIRKVSKDQFLNAMLPTQ